MSGVHTVSDAVETKTNALKEHLVLYSVAGAYSSCNCLVEKWLFMDTDSTEGDFPGLRTYFHIFISANLIFMKRLGDYEPVKSV